MSETAMHYEKGREVERAFIVAHLRHVAVLYEDALGYDGVAALEGEADRLEAGEHLNSTVKRALVEDRAMDQRLEDRERTFDAAHAAYKETHT